MYAQVELRSFLHFTIANIEINFPIVPAMEIRMQKTAPNNKIPEKYKEYILIL